MGRNMPTHRGNNVSVSKSDAIKALMYFAQRAPGIPKSAGAFVARIGGSRRRVVQTIETLQREYSAIVGNSRIGFFIAVSGGQLDQYCKLFRAEAIKLLEQEARHRGIPLREILLDCAHSVDECVVLESGKGRYVAIRRVAEQSTHHEQ